MTQLELHHLRGSMCRMGKWNQRANCQAGHEFVVSRRAKAGTRTSGWAELGRSAPPDIDGRAIKRTKGDNGDTKLQTKVPHTLLIYGHTHSGSGTHAHAHAHSCILYMCTYIPIRTAPIRTAPACHTPVQAARRGQFVDSFLVSYSAPGTVCPFRG